MNEEDMVKFYVKHEVNRHISAAVMAFGRKIDELVQAGEKVVGRTFQVKFKAPHEAICRNIGLAFSRTKSGIADYIVEGNGRALFISATIRKEPTDLATLQKEEQARIEDTLLLETERNKGSTSDIENREVDEVINITKEDIQNEKHTVH